LISWQKQAIICLYPTPSDTWSVGGKKPDWQPLS